MRGEKIKKRGRLNSDSIRKGEALTLKAKKLTKDKENNTKTAKKNADANIINGANKPILQDGVNKPILQKSIIHKENIDKGKFLRIEHEIPKGIKVLMIYTSVLALFYLLLVFLSDVTLFFGFVLNGTAARFTYFMFFISSLIMVYGFAYKKSWCFDFSIAVYLICIANSLLSIFFIRKVNSIMFTSLYSIIIPVFIVTLLMNVLTLWYIYEKKAYFKDPLHQHRHSIVDKVFIYSIYIFYFSVVIFIIVLGVMTFLTATQNMSYAMSATAGMDVSDGEAYCEKITDVESRDICFLAVVYNHKNEGDISKLCRSIELGYYQFTCYKVLGVDRV